MKKNEFNFKDWESKREKGFLKYIYKSNIVIIVSVTLLCILIYKTLNTIEYYVSLPLLLIFLNLRNYYDWWNNEEKFMNWNEDNESLS